jgi:hypothetical protein
MKYSKAGKKHLFFYAVITYPAKGIPTKGKRLLSKTGVLLSVK